MLVEGSFSGLEILIIAMAMEDEGMSFYKKGAENTQGQLRLFLLNAAEQERMHKEKFENFYNIMIKNKTGIEEDYLFDPDVSAYLKSMVKKEVFDRTPVDKEAFADLKSSVEYALNAEETTVALYTKMYESTKHDEMKDLLSIMIDEEKAHVKYFKSLLVDL